MVETIIVVCLIIICTPIVFGFIGWLFGVIGWISLGVIAFVLKLLHKETEAPPVGTREEEALPEVTNEPEEEKEEEVLDIKKMLNSSIEDAKSKNERMKEEFSDSLTIETKKFSPLKPLLQELVDSIDSPKFDASVNNWDATMNFHNTFSDAYWEIKIVGENDYYDDENVSYDTYEDTGEAVSETFMVEERRLGDDLSIEKKLYFHTPEEVIKYLVKEIGETLA